MSAHRKPRRHNHAVLTYTLRDCSELTCDKRQVLNTPQRARTRSILNTSARPLSLLGDQCLWHQTALNSAVPTVRGPGDPGRPFCYFLLHAISFPEINNPKQLST